jgi:transposase-like protein
MRGGGIIKTREKPMAHKRHVIPADVKEQILERVKLGEQSIPEIAAEHGLNNTTIYKWLGKRTEAHPSWMEYNKLALSTNILERIAYPDVGRERWLGCW